MIVSGGYNFENISRGSASARQILFYTSHEEAEPRASTQTSMSLGLPKTFNAYSMNLKGVSERTWV